MTPSLLQRITIAVAVGVTGLSSGPPALAVSIEGGGSFDDAPLVHAGTYHDTILPQETLFYAVALGEGQRLLVDADVDLSPGSKGERGNADALGGFGLTFYTPLRERLPAAYVGDPFRGGSDLQRDGDTRRGPRAVGAAAADRRKAAGTGEWIGPGLYTFTAAISAVYQDTGAVVEFPLRLRVTIEGRPVPPARIGPGPLGEPAAPASAAQAGGADRASSPPVDAPARVSIGVLLAAAAATFLAGALLAGIASVMTGRAARAGPLA